jgi:hypothetical protein
MDSNLLRYGAAAARSLAVQQLAPIPPPPVLRALVCVSRIHHHHFVHECTARTTLRRLSARWLVDPTRNPLISLAHDRHHSLPHMHCFFRVRTFTLLQRPFHSICQVRSLLPTFIPV